MVKDAEDSHRIQTTNLKNLGQFRRSMTTASLKYLLVTNPLRLSQDFVRLTVCCCLFTYLAERGSEHSSKEFYSNIAEIRVGLKLKSSGV